MSQQQQVPEPSIESLNNAHEISRSEELKVTYGHLEFNELGFSPVVLEGITLNKSGNYSARLVQIKKTQGQSSLSPAAAAVLGIENNTYYGLRSFFVSGFSSEAEAAAISDKLAPLHIRKVTSSSPIGDVSPEQAEYQLVKDAEGIPVVNSKTGKPVYLETYLEVGYSPDQVL